MIIDQQTHKVETNLTGSVEFSVSEDSAKIFSFLSNFLYKDKERSVLTELTSNAYDAHVMVGKADVPFEVHLPTSLVPELTIRDFGPGMSTEQVYQFLTKYGSSSKNKSADTIGGYGIGSKSPAAVSDTWTINSYHDGKKSTYLIHINDRGIPSINKILDVDTSETGLEVKIPVSTRNINLWQNAAHVVFSHYPVMPIIRGMSGNVPKTADVTLDLGLYTFYGSKYSYGYRVIMNHRAYELDTTKIDKSMSYFLNIEGLCMKFGVSELSVSLSREDLQYDSKTIAAINDRISKMVDMVSGKWKTDVSTKTTLFDYKLAASELMAAMRLTPTGAKVIATALGDKFVDTVDFSNVNAFSIVIGDAAVYGGMDVFKTKIKVISTHDGKLLPMSSTRHEYKTGCSFNLDSYYNHTNGKPSRDMLIRFRATNRDQVVFYYGDVNGYAKRYLHAVEEGKIPKKGCLAITDAEIWKKIPDDFIKIVASDLDKAPVVRQPKSVVNVVSDFYRRKGNRLTKVEESVVKGLSDVVFIKFTNAATTTSIDAADKDFVNTFGNNVELVYVKPGIHEKLPSWGVLPKEWAKKEYARLNAIRDDLITNMKSKLVRDLLRGYCRVYGTRGLVKDFLEGKIINKSDFDISGKLRTIMSEFDGVSTTNVDLHKTVAYATLNTLITYLGEKELPPIYIDDVMVKLEKAYPMLQYFNGTMSDVEDRAVVVGYINLVDKGV